MYWPLLYFFVNLVITIAERETRLLAFAEANKKASLSFFIFQAWHTSSALTHCILRSYVKLREAALFGTVIPEREARSEKNLNCEDSSKSEESPSVEGRGSFFFDPHRKVEELPTWLAGVTCIRFLSKLK